MDKKEFFRQWAVDGMPADKIRLANAAWDEATKAEREACAKLCDLLANDDNPYRHVECVGADEAGKLIRMRSNKG